MQCKGPLKTWAETTRSDKLAIKCSYTLNIASGLATDVSRYFVQGHILTYILTFHAGYVNVLNIHISNNELQYSE